MTNLNVFIQETLKNGGASYNMWSGDLNPKEGYMVAASKLGVSALLVQSATWVWWRKNKKEIGRK